MKISGHVWLEHKRDGELLGIYAGPNLVVNDGRELIALIVSAAGGTKPGWFALGSGNAAIDPDDAALDAEISGSRTAFVTDLASDVQLTYGAVITASGTWTVQECGLFNAVASGVMLARFLTPSFTMVSADTLDITWILTFGE